MIDILVILTLRILPRTQNTSPKDILYRYEYTRHKTVRRFRVFSRLPTVAGFFEISQQAEKPR